MRPRIAGLAAAAVAAVTVTTGCSSSSTGIPKAVAAPLYAKVEAVRQAAASGRYSAVREAVDALEKLVRNDRTAGKLTSAQADQILNDADTLLADFSPSPSPAPSPDQTTTSPTPSPSTVVTPTTTSPTPTPTHTTTAPPSVVPTTSAASAGAGSGNSGGGQAAGLPTPSQTP